MSIHSSLVSSHQPQLTSHLLTFYSRHPTPPSSIPSSPSSSHIVIVITIIPYHHHLHHHHCGQYHHHCHQHHHHSWLLWEWDMYGMRRCWWCWWWWRRLRFCQTIIWCLCRLFLPPPSFVRHQHFTNHPVTVMMMMMMSLVLVVVVIIVVFVVIALVFWLHHLSEHSSNHLVMAQNIRQPLLSTYLIINQPRLHAYITSKVVMVSFFLFQTKHLEYR